MTPILARRFSPRSCHLNVTPAAEMVIPISTHHVEITPSESDFAGHACSCSYTISLHTCTHRTYTSAICAPGRRLHGFIRSSLPVYLRRVHAGFNTGGRPALRVILRTSLFVYTATGVVCTATRTRSGRSLHSSAASSHVHCCLLFVGLGRICNIDWRSVRSPAAITHYCHTTPHAAHAFAVLPTHCHYYSCALHAVRRHYTAFSNYTPANAALNPLYPWRQHHSWSDGVDLPPGCASFCTCRRRF